VSILYKSFKKEKISHENKLLRLAFAIGLLPFFLLIIVLYQVSMSVYLKYLMVSLTLSFIVFGAFEIKRLVTTQLRTATNLMEALSIGDYSLRAVIHGEHSALNEFNNLLNSLAQAMTKQSLVNKERHILLHKVIDQIDVAIVAVDHQDCISLMNPSAEKLLDAQFELHQGCHIKALGLQDVLTNDYKQVVEFEIKQHRKKVYLHSDEYFEEGKKHRLIFITDIQDILRDEERSAWQRLLRVLSHEINNSLAPIASISESLHSSTLQENSLLEMSDFEQGLAVISERSHHLNEFIKRYQQLSKLPEPSKTVVNVQHLLITSAALFEQVTVNDIDASITCFIDESQLQQVLINLIKNALEATDSEGDMAQVIIDVNVKQTRFEITVTDNGSGISNMDNIFVPFYTTKNAGSGIGLVMSRQIMRNHGGDLLLNNRLDSLGAVATIIIP